MKKKTTIWVTSIAAICILCSKGNAQVSIRSTESTIDMVMLANNLSSRIINLFVLDSLVANEPGQTRDYNTPLVHLANFELELGNTAAKDILKTLYSAMQGQQLPNLVLNKVNAQGRIVERREYNSIIVKEIILPELKSDAREAARAKVYLQAANVLYDNSPGGNVHFGPEKGARMTSPNIFRLEMGSLPTQKVMRVGTIKIVPSSVTGYLYFNLDVPSDDARQWNDWLRANNTGGGNQTPQATISLMDERQQQTLSIQIAQVEIVSISATSNPTSIPKITIGLRTTTPPAIY
jgi:hypothetical protein